MTYLAQLFSPSAPSPMPIAAPIPIPRKQVVIVALFMTMFGMFLLPFCSSRLLQHLFMLMPFGGPLGSHLPPVNPLSQRHPPFLPMTAAAHSSVRQLASLIEFEAASSCCLPGWPKVAGVWQLNCQSRNLSTCGKCRLSAGNSSSCPSLFLHFELLSIMICIWNLK